jgi:hypothetical protein
MHVRKGLAGLAGVAGLLLFGALSPSAALAHPCIAEAEAAGAGLTLHSGGNWAGYMPTFEDLEHECADDLSSSIYQSVSVTDAAADPVEDAVATFDIKNLKPLGYSARSVPMTGTGSSVYNSDLAFKDNLVIAGTYEGFRIIDVTDKTNPVELVNQTGCNVGQGDVVVYGNILVRSWDSEVRASNADTAACGGQLVGLGFEGFHVWDISNPASPQMVKQVKFADNEIPEGGIRGCGSHTASAVPDPTRDALYIYNGGSSGSCPGIDIFKIKISDPTDVTFIKRAEHGRPGNSCHDNNVLMNVGGTTTGYAMCAGGSGLAMFKFDLALAAGAEGGVENPTLLWAQPMPGVGIGHSGSFTYDGKYLIFGHEPGGGSQARCEATDSVSDRTLFFLDPLTGDIAGTMLHPRPQTNRENCTWHNFNVVPTKAGYYATVGSYQSGIAIIDFTNPATPREIAYADPAPLSTTSTILGGDWSTYWHNGYIYESDIKRGVVTWELDLEGAEYQEAAERLKRTTTFAQSNPQTQMTSYVPENEPPVVTIAAPIDGGEFLQNSPQLADYSCADNVAVDSCVGTVADGAPMDMSTIGYHTFSVTATDSAGNQTTETVSYVVNSTAVDTPVGAAVPATLALSLGTPASFGAFVPGVAGTYSAGTTANVVSTAGDGVLSVADPSSTNTGRLMNGSFTLANPLMASATSAGGTGSAAAPVGGSAAPTSLLTYTGPTSNDAVTLSFSQAIGQNEALRTGTYSKTLTFTLSTTAP